MAIAIGCTAAVTTRPNAASTVPEGAKIWDAAHRHVAYVAGGAGKQVLMVDGVPVWPRSGQSSFRGEPVWSTDGRGLAVLDDGARGPHLVVLVDYADPSTDLTWPVPREALAPGLRVFWASERKVMIGEEPLNPRFAAGWEEVR